MSADETPVTRGETEHSDGRPADVALESPENVAPKAWMTMALFAAFVVLTSGCMISLFTR